MLIIANEQTKGRGKYGRNFYSPAGTGIYMTYAFFTNKSYDNIGLITTKAAAMIAKVLGSEVKIKWVNDLYFKHKKVGGILTESFPSKKHNGIYVMVGIGINLTTKKFPHNIENKAGSINKALNKELLIAEICNNLLELMDSANQMEYLEYYRKNMLGIGKKIYYKENKNEHQAIVLGINENGGLIVNEYNKIKTLYSEEITFEDYNIGKKQNENKY